MVMTSTALVAAAVSALLAGQSSDQLAFQIYQARLARLMAVQGTTSSSAAASPSGSNLATGAPTACILTPGSGNQAATSDCTACHASFADRHSHPVDVYMSNGRSGSLRTAAEVVRRGVFLADGKVTCLSCHDGNSSWKYHLALPPDAKVRPRVVPGKPETYENPEAPRPAALMAAGSDVSPTPLCKACHAFD